MKVVSFSIRNLLLFHSLRLASQLEQKAVEVVKKLISAVNYLLQK